jgi:hypothetical protein
MAENTAAMLILLTNGKSQSLTLTSAKITGSSSASKLDLPPTLTQGTFGGYGTPASTTPYQATWSYSPDGGGNAPDLHLQPEWAQGNPDRALEDRSGCRQLDPGGRTEV